MKQEPRRVTSRNLRPSRHQAAARRAEGGEDVNENVVNSNYALFFLVAMLGFSALGLLGMGARQLLAFRKFRQDDRNPYRRYCRQCRQCQVQYCLSSDSAVSWWATQGDILQEDCSCHKHAATC